MYAIGTNTTLQKDYLKQPAEKKKTGKKDDYRKVLTDTWLTLYI